MNLIYNNSLENSKIVLTDFSCADGRSLLKDDGLYKIIWTKNSESKLLIDGCYTSLVKNQILFCTPLNIIKLFNSESNIISIVFNREFYCIKDNDKEVSCNGFLFYGSPNPATINLDSIENNLIKEIYKNFELEFSYKDNLQGEMIRTLLKRLLIKSNRMLDKKTMSNQLKRSEKDMIRKFNILVEQHYKTHHKVTEYASMLSKSPKTIANVFLKHSETTPLMVINDRILIEARRLILFSEKTVKEIGKELGYNYESHFSKFFKNNIGATPVAFKKSWSNLEQGNNI